MRLSHLRLLAPALFGLLALLPSSASSQSEELTFHYRYFKKSVGLTLDLSRLSVMDRSTQPQNEKPSLSAALKDTLRRHDIPEELTVPLFKNFALAAVPQDKRQSKEAVKSLLHSIQTNCSTAFVSPIFLNESGSGPIAVTDVIFVLFNSDTTEGQAQAILSSIDAEDVTQRQEKANVGVRRLRCRTRNGFEVLAIANALAENPLVSFAEPNLISRPVAFTNPIGSLPVSAPGDPLFGYQWGLSDNSSGYDPSLNALYAWAYTKGNAGIKVAVLGHPIYSHSDIRSGVGWDATLDPPQPMSARVLHYADDPELHETQIAGVISAKENGAGTVGIAPECVVVPIRVYNDAGVGDSWSLAEGILLAERTGARATTFSYGPDPSALIVSAYEQTRGRGMIHFASSGNRDTLGIPYPATLRSVNSVGAVTNTSTRFQQADGKGSTYGEGLTFMAPGKDIWTTTHTRRYLSGQIQPYWDEDWTATSGTSVAAPFAAGMAALIFSVNPALTADEVWMIMRRSARPVVSQLDSRFPYNMEHGWGRVDAWPAVAHASHMWPVGMTVSPDTTRWLLWNGNEHRTGYPSGGRTFVQRIWPDGTINYANLQGPYENWYAQGIAVGNDNRPVVLLRSIQGNSITLWKLSWDCSVWYWSGLTGEADARAIAVGVAPDNTVRVLWNHDDGRVTLWKLDASFNHIATVVVCQWPDMRAVDLCVDNWGRTYILFGKTNSPDYEVRLLDANLTQLYQSYGLSYVALGPDSAGVGTTYSGYYIATKIAIGSDDRVRILYNGLNGVMRVNTYPSPFFWSWGVSNPESLWQYGPAPLSWLPGWSASASVPTMTSVPKFSRSPRGMAVGPDNLLRMLWTQEDGTAFLWRLQPNPSNPMYYFLETSADLQETIIPRPD